ncbi:MAG: primosomal protein N' [Leptospiraceae bacterium]|nr:primosomal protein N' [Leptospiraceae bacterium]
MIRYAEVALNIPFKDSDTLSYEIPETMKSIERGCRVDVGMKGRKLQGLVVDIHSNMPKYKTYPITKLIDKTPVVNEEQIELAYWMKDFYLTSLGECLQKMIPTGKKTKAFFPQIPSDPELLKLNDEQKQAFEKIKNGFGKEETHLLYGITGSGKTEVYIHLLFEILTKTNRSAILLVPEISLTVQTLSRLEQIFGNSLAMIHSMLKVSERYNNYLKLLSGEKRIVVGTRSAVFAPVKNLGLIIMDEEHDHSYKEHSSPRYHARQIAQRRANINSCPVVLGSATPSVEAFHFAKTGKIFLHTLRKRAKEAKLPEIKIITNKKGTVISDELVYQIKKRLDKKEQVVLLLNRRGYSPLIYDKTKKEFLGCPKCSSNLCYHKTGKMICHLCGFQEKMNRLKENDNLELLGSGTQKLEEYILEKFPNVRLERLDQDAASKREIIPEIIKKLLNEEIDILTGTQMIAKGLDASKVTLVGVVNATIGLGLPDFRASERVFSLLTQVSGRAGRGKLEGEVFIESSTEDHPILELAKTQNYEKFFHEEILVRKNLFLPPFSRIIRLVTRSPNEEKSKLAITELERLLKEELKQNPLENTILLGPVECPFYKIDTYYRNHLLFKTLQISKLKELIKLVLEKFKPHSSVYLEIDVDPLDLV